MRRKEPPTFDLPGFLTRLNELVEAEKLLEGMHLEHGAYGDGKITDETRRKVNDYFNFDDSE